MKTKRPRRARHSALSAPPMPASTQTQSHTIVTALIDTSANGNGELRGCGSVGSLSSGSSRSGRSQTCRAREPQLPNAPPLPSTLRPSPPSVTAGPANAPDVGPVQAGQSPLLCGFLVFPRHLFTNGRKQQVGSEGKPWSASKTCRRPRPSHLKPTIHGTIPMAGSRAFTRASWRRGTVRHPRCGWSRWPTR